MVSLFLGFACVDQAAWPKPRHDFGQARIRDGEAALASTEHPEVADHSLIHVPGTMHYDRPGQRVAIGRVQSLEPDRVTMSADIERTRSIGSSGGRVRVRLIGEALEPSRMSGVGAPSMGNQVRPHAALGEVHQVKPRSARGKGEVGDADKIPVADAVVMLLQSIERTPQQTGIYLALDTFWPSECEPSSCGSRSKAGKRKIDKKTAGKYQDIELQHQ